MLDSYQDLIEELTGTPAMLRRLLDGVPAGAPPEAVTAMAELRDRDTAVLERLQIMMRQRDPVLRALPDGVEETGGDAEETLAGFNSARGEVVSLLMNLTLRDWVRTAIDEHGQTITMDEEVERHVEYDEEHVARIRSLFGAA